ncbi:MAG: DUF5665 domain-containing protein [Pseudomonadota bacterium]
MTIETEPSQDLRDLDDTLKKLGSTRFIAMHNSIWQLLWINFLKGVAVGLGTVVGATVVLSIIIYLLSQMDFIPVLGEWATRLKSILEEG